MKIFTFILFALSIMGTISYSKAEELRGPSFLQLPPVSGDNKNTLLFGECKKSSKNKIKCNFSQLIFSTKSLETQQIESLLDELRKEYSNMNDIKTSKFCSSNAVSKFKNKFRDINSQYEKDIIDVFLKALSACKASSIDGAFRIVKDVFYEYQKLSALSCKIRVHSFQLSFEAITNNQNSYWQSKSEPALNPCGQVEIVTLKNYEEDGKTNDLLWEYKSQRIITMPDNKMLGNMKCSDIRQKPRVWSWQGSSIIKECREIGF